jgi:hypothetical protein
MIPASEPPPDSGPASVKESTTTEQQHHEDDDEQCVHVHCLFRLVFCLVGERAKRDRVHRTLEMNVGDVALPRSGSRQLQRAG